MKISVKTLKNNHFDLEVNPTDTVWSLLPSLKHPCMFWHDICFIAFLVYLEFFLSRMVVNECVHVLAHGSRCLLLSSICLPYLLVEIYAPVFRMWRVLTLNTFVDRLVCHVYAFGQCVPFVPSLLYCNRLAVGDLLVCVICSSPYFSFVARFLLIL